MGLFFSVGLFAQLHTLLWASILDCSTKLTCPKAHNKKCQLSNQINPQSTQHNTTQHRICPFKLYNKCDILVINSVATTIVWVNTFSIKILYAFELCSVCVLT